MVSGCASKIGYRHYFEKKPQAITFPEVGKEMMSDPGQIIYETYQGHVEECLELIEPFKGNMPGPLFAPFRFSINSKTLVKKFEAGDHLYFVAKEGEANADIPGGFRVIRNEDIIGVRVSSNGEFEWFVDSSAYNTDHVPRLWTRPLTEDEGLNLIHKKNITRLPLQTNSAEIRFAGGSAKELKLRVVINRVHDSFTYDMSKLPQKVNIAGGVLEITSFTKEGQLKYKWEKLPSLFSGRLYIQN